MANCSIYFIEIQGRDKMQFIRKYWDIVFFPITIICMFVILKLMGIMGVSVYELLGIVIGMVGITLIKREIAFGQLVSLFRQFFLILHFLPLKLYGQIAFCVIWAIINLITFFMWRKRRGDKALSPSYMNTGWVLLIFVGLIVLIWLQIDSGSIGILDYSVVYLGVLGQLILMKKKIQGWGLWFIADIMGIILFFMTASYLLCVRTILYMFNEVFAYKRWKKEIKNK
jgi:nicotinamide mononucleotide transporter PnuC